jgi:hypothetical protein
MIEASQKQTTNHLVLFKGFGINSDSFIFLEESGIAEKALGTILPSLMGITNHLRRETKRR